MLFWQGLYAVNSSCLSILQILCVREYKSSRHPEPHSAYKGKESREDLRKGNEGFCEKGDSDGVRS
jgi:hypothetical protein